MKNLTAKPFKNGDRVVPSMKLWKRLETRSCTGIGSQDNPTAWFFNGEFVALGDVRYSIDQNGRLNRVDEQDLYFLHAPAFGNLKEGDDNPFVVGMPVKITFAEGEVKAMVSNVRPGPSVRVNFEYGAREWAGWYNNGRPFQGPYDINTIFPATQEQPAHAAGFEFGDKVKVEGRTGPYNVILDTGDTVHCSGSFESHIIGKSCGSYNVHFFSKRKVSPWIERITIYTKLNDQHRAQVTTDKGITVGCQEISFEAFDELAAAVAKVREA
jgi:hypothetical protein